MNMTINRQIVKFYIIRYPSRYDIQIRKIYKVLKIVNIHADLISFDHRTKLFHFTLINMSIIYHNSRIYSFIIFAINISSMIIINRQVASILSSSILNTAVQQNAVEMLFICKDNVRWFHNGALSYDQYAVTRRDC